MVLDTSLLNTQHYKVRIKLKYFEKSEKPAEICSHLDLREKPPVEMCEKLGRSERIEMKTDT